MTYWFTVVGYLIILLIGVVLWVSTRGRGGKFASLSEVFKRVMHYRGSRLGLMMFWWWLGWHFLVSVVHR
jgi:preprotein translocase subunit SecG